MGDVITHHACITELINRLTKSSVNPNNMRHGKAWRQMAQPVIDPSRAAVVEGGPSGMRRVNEELRDCMLDVAHNVVHLCREGVQYILRGAKRHPSDQDAEGLAIDTSTICLRLRGGETAEGDAGASTPGARAEVIGWGKARRLLDLQMQVKSRLHSKSKAHDGGKDNRGRTSCVDVIHDATCAAPKRPKLLIQCLQLGLDAHAEDA
jgi:hypothetical protein